MGHRKVTLILCLFSPCSLGKVYFAEENRLYQESLVSAGVRGRRSRWFVLHSDLLHLRAGSCFNILLI